jgi:hypothetical protein
MKDMPALLTLPELSVPVELPWPWVAMARCATVAVAARNTVRDARESAIRLFFKPVLTQSLVDLQMCFL